MKFKIYFLIPLLFLLYITKVFAYGEEKLDSLGNLNSVHSASERHSTFHYDLVKLIAIKAGYPLDSAELIARYSALVDQINPKPGYPYPSSLNATSIPDTFPTWPQSLAGTERGGVGINSFGENPGVYWHFALRNPADAATGRLVYANDYPHPVPASYKGPSNFWRVPFSYYLDKIYSWAIQGTGSPGRPESDTPHDVYYFDTDSNKYELVPPASIISLAILLHSIGDSYSHEECAVTDTTRSHPALPLLCNANYHRLEMPYQNFSYAYPHIDSSARAMWRALRAYSQARSYNYSPLWLDNNGNNEPDELEETGDAAHTATFIERWKAPETLDLNSDGLVNHYDHSARRIGLAKNEVSVGINDNSFSPKFSFDVFPNPASGKIYIRIYDTHPAAEVVLVDVTGRKLVERKMSGDTEEIDVSGFPDGIYFIAMDNSFKKIMIAGH